MQSRREENAHKDDDTVLEDGLEQLIVVDVVGLARLGSHEVVQRQVAISRRGGHVLIGVERC